MASNSCVYFECNRNRKTHCDLSFFRFPTETQRRRTWLINCGNARLFSLLEDQLREKKVCAVHFTEQQFMHSLKNRLTHNAIPQHYKTGEIGEITSESNQPSPPSPAGAVPKVYGKDKVPFYSESRIGENLSPVLFDLPEPTDSSQDSFLMQAPNLGIMASSCKSCAKKCGKAAAGIDPAVMQKMETGFAKLASSNSKSLLKKYLTKSLFDKLKNRKTSFGSTLLDCIQSGLENHDSGIGIYAPDADAYNVFAELFDAVIEDYHIGFTKNDRHPPSDFGDVNQLGNVDPKGEYVVSTRVRCGRSLDGYPFNPCLTEAQYKEMERKVSTALNGLTGELKGTFYPLTGMDKQVQQQLIDDHFLFKEGDRFLQAANACRFWPTGRGIFHNDNKTFLVWCNEEDHLRIISMQQGGDLGEIYKRLVTGVQEIEKKLKFSRSDRLGYLTFCPTNLGTTIRASVHIKVPKLAANYSKLEEVAGRYNLQVRGTRGEHTEAEGGVYDISNKRRMGLTEFDAVKEMHDGIAEIIKHESAA